MNLAAYMQNHSLDDVAMAAKIRDCSPSAVKKWRYGERVPRAQQMLRIIEATGGDVTPNDFLPIAARRDGDAA
jgi:DNA-binding transcriptional regulator YdaS (Cro superfamily)